MDTKIIAHYCEINEMDISEYADSIRCESLSDWIESMCEAHNISDFMRQYTDFSKILIDAPEIHVFQFDKKIIDFFGDNERGEEWAINTLKSACKYDTDLWNIYILTTGDY